MPTMPLPLGLLIFLVAAGMGGFLGGLLGVGGGLLVVAALSVTLLASASRPARSFMSRSRARWAGMVVTFGSTTIAHLMSGSTLRLVVVGFCVLASGWQAMMQMHPVRAGDWRVNQKSWTRWGRGVASEARGNASCVQGGSCPR